MKWLGDSEMARGPAGGLWSAASESPPPPQGSASADAGAHAGRRGRSTASGDPWSQYPVLRRRQPRVVVGAPGPGRPGTLVSSAQLGGRSGQSICIGMVDGHPGDNSCGGCFSGAGCVDTNGSGTSGRGTEDHWAVVCTTAVSHSACDDSGEAKASPEQAAGAWRASWPTGPLCLQCGVAPWYILWHHEGPAGG